MRTLVVLGLLPIVLSACRRDPDDFTPSETGIVETLIVETGIVDTETGRDTGDSSETGPETGPDTASETGAETGETAPIEDADGDLFTIAQGDCDDANPSLYPGAEEVCDGVDQDCDGDADDGVLGTFYADVDGDGYGDPATGSALCEGAVENDTDCDDTRADVNPGAVEACDGADNDCDDAIDEEGLSTWYTDADADGYGDVTTGALDCAPGAGQVSDPSDCDDTDAAISPAATETCDSADNDCDGATDEGVTTVWYIDYDADGYGTDSYRAYSCTAPAGYVATDDDCDDVARAVNPGATELCNAIDDDCDGTTDEPDAAGAPTWYYDGDADAWGDSAVSQVACDQPTNYVSADGDCDDTDPDSWPGAPERYDGVDDDCDGRIDDNTWIGTGVDGALVVNATTDLSVDASAGRAFADGVTYAVTAIAGADVTLSAADGLVAGDEVLIVSLHGSDAAYGSVGTYEFGFVSAVSGTSVTLDAGLLETFGEASNADLSDQAIVLVRVAQYTDVTIGGAGLLTAGTWDGAVGGVLAFRATGTVSIASGGAVAADEAGYAGGTTGTYVDGDAFQGESYAGAGDGNLPGGSGYNEYAGYWMNNYGGGGALVTGGGGEHAGGATPGDSWNGGAAAAPEPGEVYGEIDLTRLFFGSGGAGVWRGGSYPGSGGGGGGIVYIGASALSADGAEAITALGGTTSHWATGSWTYGAGGGAGGSIWLVADTLTLAGGAIDAQGGLGESTHIRIGGDGGVGRVRVDCNAVNGVACATSASAAELANGAEPDVGWEAVP